MNKRKYIFIILSLFIVSGCGKNEKGQSIKSEPVVDTPVKEPLEVEMSGIYQALLAPINKKVSGHLNGSLNIVREEDDFVASVRFSGGPVSVLHTQNVHIGTRCPSDEDDQNGDGYIDAKEGAEVYKEVLIPLDDDLNSQWMGLGTFPVSDEFGYYLWGRTASYSRMLDDLKEEDINLSDNLVKISDNKSFNVTSSVVVIYGVPESTVLPDTVAPLGRKTKHQGLPVACGVIRKLTHVPGTIDDDTTGIPVPEDGETIGGSGGSDDGALFNRPEATGGSGNYGEEEDEEVSPEDSVEIPEEERELPVP